MQRLPIVHGQGASVWQPLLLWTPEINMDLMISLGLGYLPLQWQEGEFHFSDKIMKRKLEFPTLVMQEKPKLGEMGTCVMYRKGS